MLIAAGVPLRRLLFEQNALGRFQVDAELLQRESLFVLFVISCLGLINTRRIEFRLFEVEKVPPQSLL